MLQRTQKRGRLNTNSVPLRLGVALCLLLAVILVSCGPDPTATTDITAIETAVARSVIATLTAEAPTPTPIPTPTSTSTPVPYNIYFGDLHVHTSKIHTAPAFREEFGRGVIRLAHLHARDVMDHDFIAVTNHARLLDDWMWEVTQQVANEFTQDGEFVSFPAFEWTASHQCGTHFSVERPDYPDWGHRTVYFRDSEVAPSLLSCNDPKYDTPEEFFEALPGPDVATTIPHHTAAGRISFDWSTVNSRYDRLVEIIQHRGIYETDIIENGWSQGHILGVVGGSDNHIAIPGWPQGVSAILAPALTRDALFDALLQRHTYATSHGDIILHFFGDGEMQGGVLPDRTAVRLNGEVVGTSGDVSLVELVDNGAVIQSWRPSQSASFRFDTTQEVEDEPHYFYIRVTLSNDHQAWSSPIWVNYPDPEL